MRSRYIPLALAMIFLALAIDPAVHPAGAPVEAARIPEAAQTRAAMEPVLDAMGSTFVENVGQAHGAGVMFYSTHHSVAFTRDSVLLYAMENKEVGNSAESDAAPNAQLGTDVVGGRTVRLSFPGSNAVVPIGLEPASWRTNYFLGKDPASWRTGLGNYRAVAYEQLWDGIDLIYRIGGSGVKYEFILDPTADPNDISIMIEGHEALSVNTGALVIGTGLGPGSEIVDSGLEVFYSDGAKEKIGARFGFAAQNIVKFELDEPMPGRSLVIDPLIYSTFLGGAAADSITSVSVGADGCAYVTGSTLSADFPTTPGAFTMSFNGYSEDVFVAKLGLNGDSLVYSTFLGGSGADVGQCIAAAADGSAYLAGYTISNTFPTTVGAYDITLGSGDTDAFITKLSPMGDALLYSTYLGGTRSERAKGIAIDAHGYAYVTGFTYSTFATVEPPIEFRSTPADSPLDDENFPVTPGTLRWGVGDSLCDIFVTKFNQVGGALVYSAVFGTESYDYSNCIAVDSAGYAYIAGDIRSASFPVSSYAVDKTYGGGLDAFVMKLTPTCSAPAYSTYLGGSKGETAYGIAVGQWGHAYVTGYTSSPDFPTTPGAADTTHNGNKDAFVATISKYGDALAYSTFIGGSGNDYGNGIAVDSLECAHIAGYTDSADLPATGAAYCPQLTNGTDAMVAKLPASGDSFLTLSYLGGSSEDFANGIGVSDTGYTYVAGSTKSSDIPTANGSFDRSYNGAGDGFVTKLDLAQPLAAAGPDQTINEDTAAVFDASGSVDNQEIAGYVWTFSDGTSGFEIRERTASHLFANPGRYMVTLNVTDTSGNWALDALILRVIDITHPVAMAGQDQQTDEDVQISFDGSASTDNVAVVNHTWSFAYNGTTAMLYGHSQNFTFFTPGSYNVTLTARDQAGNKGMDWLMVLVRDITGPSANAGRDMSIYRNSTARFDGSRSADNVAIVNYTWSLSDGTGNISLHGSAPTHFFGIPGVYPVTLNVTDAAGHSATDTMVLTVLETIPPIAEAGLDILTNETCLTVFDGSSCTDNVGVVRWLWTFNDGLNDVGLVGVSPVWTFARPGTFEVLLNASDAAGNWDTDSLTVTVADTQLPTSVPGQNRIVMPGALVYLDGTGSSDDSGISYYEWSFRYNGTGMTLLGSSQSFQFWAPGTYMVTLIVRDGAGNQASNVTAITVLQARAESPILPKLDAYGHCLIAGAMALVAVSVAVIAWRRRREG